MLKNLNSYDPAVAFTINTYSEKANSVCLIEYGRGDKELAQQLLDSGKTVYILDDFMQTIYAPADGRYDGLEDNLIEHNIFSNQEVPDIKVDFIFASIPHLIPNVPNDLIYPKIETAFEKMYSMLNEGGYILTLDFNQDTIYNCVTEMFNNITPLIETDPDEFYIAAIRHG